jgi:hypothetical protein
MTGTRNRERPFTRLQTTEAGTGQLLDSLNDDGNNNKVIPAPRHHATKTYIEWSHTRRTLPSVPTGQETGWALDRKAKGKITAATGKRTSFIQRSQLLY